jgi:hypothetical protein
MFLDHFQFAEQPFGATPDPRFLFLVRLIGKHSLPFTAGMSPTAALPR